jgi:hypothetical protein
MNNQELTIDDDELFDDQPLTIDQLKEFATLLYTKDNRITVIEIAGMVGVPEETIDEWVKQAGLDKQRAAELTRRQTQVYSIYAQLNAINTAIKQKPPGERYPDSKQADIISKLVATIRAIENEVSLAAVLDVRNDFINFVRENDFEFLGVCVKHFDGYIKTLLN